ncbi:MAG TPA: hypothetical protein VFY99_04110 [Solirubrobacterales bacterium]
MTQPTRAVLAVASAILLSACGGGDSTTEDRAEQSPAEAEAAIEETWAAFADAVEKGDGATACAELSDRLAEPNEMNLQLGSPLRGGPGCEETLGDRDATLSFAAGLSAEFAELEVDGATASGVAGAAHPTFAESGGKWEITSVFGQLPEE